MKGDDILKGLFLILCVLMVLGGCATGGKVAQPDTRAVQSEKPGDDYIIGSGDILDVSLWKDEAMTKQVTVLTDGKIVFPLIGEVKAAGRTLGEVKQDMIERLKEYVPEPVLNVDVKQVNSMIVYVTGRVTTPGRYPVNTRVTVLQALSIAGGVNAFAKRSKIKIFRQEGNKTITYPFNYNEVVDGENLQQNIVLKRGDVIVVP